MEQLAIEMLAVFDFSAAGGKVMNALAVVLGLGLVIFFHELGHFAVAKWCNVHVERFSIGIGPILWSRQKGETEYALSALPFGGYVKMLGQDDMDSSQMTSDEIAENPRAYTAKSVPQRMAIISAGVIMNVLTGFLVFMLCYRMGVEEPSPLVGSVTTGFPAWSVGIRSGDRITAINDSEIRSFGDIFNAVKLSMGALRIQGVHDDGTTFDETIAPERWATGRSIGVSPAYTTTISPRLLDPDKITSPGLPAASASARIMPGDRLVSIQSEPVQSYSQMQRLSAKHAGVDRTYIFERSATDSDKDAGATATTVEVVIPAVEVRDIGLWMAMGPIKAIRKGSIAERAGLQPGDRMIQVDDYVIGRDYDPLRLPNYFAERAGEPVKLIVERQTPATGIQKQEITLIPDDLPGWIEDPLFQTTPLAISAIGAAFQVQPRIAHIVPGSEAEKSGKFREGQKISKVVLEHTDPAAVNSDPLGDPATPKTILLAELEKKQPGSVEEINWAYAFSIIQRLPQRSIRFFVQEGDQTVDYLLSERSTVDGWYLSDPGINGWQGAAELQRANNLSDAFALGIRKTRNTGINIYLTLRSLVRGDLPWDSLSGPLGIVNIGYQVAAHGLTDLLLFLGFLSINLAVINFLPIPVLDGGHMVFLLWEGISRRKPNATVIGWAHAMGILFIISLFVFVMYLDIFVNKMGMGG